MKFRPKDIRIIKLTDRSGTTTYDIEVRILGFWFLYMFSPINGYNTYDKAKTKVIQMLTRTNDKPPSREIIQYGFQIIDE